MPVSQMFAYAYGDGVFAVSLADGWVTTVGDHGGVLSGTKAVAMFLLLAVTKGGALLACRKLQMSVA